MLHKNGEREENKAGRGRREVEPSTVQWAACAVTHIYDC